MMTVDPSPETWSPRRPLLAGALLLFVGVGSLGLWAVATEIDAAVIASGRVETDARRQLVQHPDGGVVAEILVRDGDRVRAGDPLLVLDGRDLDAEARVLARRLFETDARLARLAAEAKGRDVMDIEEDLRDRAAIDPELRAVLSAEERLFHARRSRLGQALTQLDERILQLEALAEGRDRQARATERRLHLVREDLAAQNQLYSRGITERPRVTLLEREVAELDGELAGIEALAAEARSQIAATRSEKTRLLLDEEAAARAEARDLAPEQADLAERLATLERRIARLVLRAPMSGVVLGLQIHTIGGVLPPGGDVAAIVPDRSAQVLVVDVVPADVDAVHVGQSARVRLPAYNAATTPELDAVVRTVAADAIADPQTGLASYRVELALTDAGRAALETRSLLPGMPVEVFIRTGTRSPALWMLKPVLDHLSMAMREE